MNQNSPESWISKTEPIGFETPIVTEIKPPKRELDFRHLQTLGSLPDNVFLLQPDDEPPEPPQTEALAA